MKPGLFPKLVLKENKSSTSVFGNLKGLLAFGISGSVESMLRSSARDDIEVSVTIKVEEDAETNSGILRINYEREAEAGRFERFIQLLMDFSYEDRFVQVTHSLLCGSSQLTECEGWFAVFHLFCGILASFAVAAKDAFPGLAPLCLISTHI